MRLLPVFIKRKPASHPGLQGVTPWHVFAFFLRVKKEGGPQAKPEKDGYGGLSAHKERNPTQKSYRLRGHFLLSEFQLVATKGSKNAAGSFAPGLPENVPIFSS